MDDFVKEDPFLTAHKPKEEGFPYELETDSLADSMGLRLPNRSLYVLQGAVGGGKSLISQRLAYGLSENGVKVKTESKCWSLRLNSPLEAGLNRWNRLDTV